MMCGICCILQSKCNTPQFTLPADWLDLKQHLVDRGPDGHAEHTITINGSDNVAMYLFASVLHMQGSLVTRQPLVSVDRRSALVYNGELYDFFNHSNNTIDYSLSSSVAMATTTVVSDTQWLFDSLRICESDANVLHLLSSLNGPFSFIFVHDSSIWVVRDLLGRKSLLWSNNNNFSSLIFSSIASTSGNWHEFPAGVAVRLQFQSSTSSTKATVYQMRAHVTERSAVDCLIDCLRLQFHCVDYLIEIARPELFQITRQPTEIDYDDLKLKSDNSYYLWKMSDVFDHLTIKYRSVIDQFIDLLLESIKRRVRSWSSANVAVLFSGGVDSALIAALLDHHCFVDGGEPVRLINVSFSADAPDRLAAQQTLTELQENSKNIEYQLLEFEYSLAEVVAFRYGILPKLLNPTECCSKLDVSIGCALWFASGVPDATRILLTGTGADELLAGYARHRTRRKRSGADALIAELEIELDRFWKRNLGRDDRVASAHGRELRLPFLDEYFIEFVNSLPIDLKIDPNLPSGYGEKLLLRLVLWHLGYRNTAVRAKRAMQFGTRLVKLESEIEKLSVNLSTS